MKYTHLIWTTFFSLSVLLSACSKDDDKYEIFTSGANLSVDEIQLIFKASEENSTIAFDSQFPNKAGVPVKINWGEDTNLYPYTKTNISYTYPSSVKEYTITIQAPGITEINLDKEGGSQLTSIKLGDCLSLNDFKFRKTDNILEALDLSRCPNIEILELPVYSDKFDLQGLKNLDQVFISFYKGGSLTFKGMNWYEADISFYEATDIQFSDCKNLEKLVLTGYKRTGNRTKEVQNISFDSSSIETLHLAQMQIRNELDLSKLTNLKYIGGLGTDWEDIKLNEQLLTFDFTDMNIQSKSRISILDFTPCMQLETIRMLNYYNIKEVYLPETESLKYVYITQSLYMDEIRIDKREE